jgi:hypothetical protein
MLISLLFVLEYSCKFGFMSSYRLDRTKFKAQTAENAADHASYYKNLNWQERLRVASYLISIAFNYPENVPPRMDKTKFKAISRV